MLLLFGSLYMQIVNNYENMGMFKNHENDDRIETENFLSTLITKISFWILRKKSLLFVFKIPSISISKLYTQVFDSFVLISILFEAFQFEWETDSRNNEFLTENNNNTLLYSVKWVMWLYNHQQHEKRRTQTAKNILNIADNEDVRRMWRWNISTPIIFIYTAEIVVEQNEEKVQKKRKIPFLLKFTFAAWNINTCNL